MLKTKMNKTVLKKGTDNITKVHKYNIIDDYIYSTLTNEEIAEKYKTSSNNVGLIITRHMKALRNARETKLLIDNPTDFRTNQATVLLNPETINKEFLTLLSTDEDSSLTDQECIFCELLNTDGDTYRAVKISGLDVGISKTKDGRDASYRNAVELRAFYLKRKPNIAAYLKEIQKEKLKKITDGKGFIQEELLKVIERLRDSSNPASTSTYLKSVEALGRTYGAFDDKIVVENISSDSAIDLIIAKAKKARATLIDVEPEEEHSEA